MRSIVWWQNKFCLFAFGENPRTGCIATDDNADMRNILPKRRLLNYWEPVLKHSRALRAAILL